MPELDPNQGGDPTKKTYNKKATGEALKTAEAHEADNDLKLFGSCFCPFVHRVWISLELKLLDYQYVEVDVYRKPKLLLDINPRGLVPALRHGDWGCYESTVLMEYLEDLGQGEPLLPSDPKLRAVSRLWSDHVCLDLLPVQNVLLTTTDQSSHYPDLLSLSASAIAEGPDRAWRGV